MQKLKNNEARPKFTGSYKKNSMYIGLLKHVIHEITSLF